MTLAARSRDPGADTAATRAGPGAADVPAAATRRHLLLRLASGLALAGLAGCGFRLRQPVALPFRRLALAGVSTDMERALRIAAGPAVEWVATPAQAEVQIVAAVSARAGGLRSPGRSAANRAFTSACACGPPANRSAMTGSTSPMRCTKPTRSASSAPTRSAVRARRCASRGPTARSR